MQNFHTQRGEGKIGCVVTLLVLILLVSAAFKAVPVFFSNNEVITAVEMYAEAGQLERRAKQLKAQAKDSLVGVAGNTGQYVVRWVQVGESDISYHRKASEKLDITKVK